MTYWILVILGLNDKWTVYNSNRQKGIDYDYGMVINFRQIYISPEQIKERICKRTRDKGRCKKIN
jgi:hypothetical protein